MRNAGDRTTPSSQWPARIRILVRDIAPVCVGVFGAIVVDFVVRRDWVGFQEYLSRGGLLNTMWGAAAVGIPMGLWSTGRTMRRRAREAALPDWIPPAELSLLNSRVRTAGIVVMIALGVVLGAGLVGGASLTWGLALCSAFLAVGLAMWAWRCPRCGENWRSRRKHVRDVNCSSRDPTRGGAVEQRVEADKPARQLQDRP
jgi:hypothetical protein